MKETAHDAVMERVDMQGNVLGFSVLGVSRLMPPIAQSSRRSPLYCYARNSET
jgi:hypothetical protein